MLQGQCATVQCRPAQQAMILCSLLGHLVSQTLLVLPLSPEEIVRLGRTTTCSNKYIEVAPVPARKAGWTCESNMGPASSTRHLQHEQQGPVQHGEQLYQPGCPEAAPEPGGNCRLPDWPAQAATGCTGGQVARCPAVGC